MECPREQTQKHPAHYIIKYHIGSTSSSSSAAWEFIPATLDKDAMRLAVAKRETPNPAPSLAHGNRVLLLCLSLWHAFAAAVAACPTLCYNQSITREVQVTFHFKWSVDCRVCKVGTKTARIRMPGQGKWRNEWMDCLLGTRRRQSATSCYCSLIEIDTEWPGHWICWSMCDYE